MARVVDIGGDGTLFIGEDKVLRLEVLAGRSTTPVDITGWSIVFDLRDRDDAPAPPLVSKAASIIGTYNAVRSVNTQRAEVLLTDDETGSLRVARYRYTLKRTDEGAETVLAWGAFKPQRATAP